MSKKSSSQNDRLFSSVNVTFYNGVAMLLGQVDVPAGGRKVTLRLKSDDAPLALATLAVFGNVTVENVSYSIDEDTTDAIVIDPGDYFGNLFNSLAGNEAVVTNTKGETAGDGIINGISGVISRDGKDGRVALVGGKQIPFSKIGNISFKSASLSERIDRGTELQRQQSDPDSVYVSFELKAGDGAEEASATVRYVAPAPVWPVTWQLQDDALIGRAAVHSPFGDTLENAKLTLTTEQPRFFDTDSFELVVPERELVRLIEAVAPGAVEVSDEYESMPMGKSRGARMAALGAMPEHALESASFAADSGDNVDVTVSGGYAKYTLEDPITLKSGVGNIIEIFRQEVGEARRVLHYSNPHGASGVQASIATTFMNDTGLALLKGALTVGTEFDGQAILNYTRPDSRAFCVHGVDKLVDIDRNDHPTSRYLLGIDLTGGNGTVVEKTVTRTTYDVVNTGDDGATVFVDHTLQLRGRNDVTVTLEGDDARVTNIDNGRRIEVAVDGKSEGSVTIVETQVNTSSQELREPRQIDQFLSRWVLQTDHPLAGDSAVARIKELNEEVRQKQESLETLEEAIEAALADVNRLTQSLGAVNPGETGRETYTRQLAEANEKIDSYRDKGTEVAQSKRALEEQLHDALRALALEWQDEAGHKLQ